MGCAPKVCQGARHCSLCTSFNPASTPIHRPIVQSPPSPHKPRGFALASPSDRVRKCKEVSKSTARSSAVRQVSPPTSPHRTGRSICAARSSVVPALRRSSSSPQPAGQLYRLTPELDALLPCTRWISPSPSCVSPSRATCTWRADSMCFGTSTPFAPLFPPKSLRRGAFAGISLTRVGLYERPICPASSSAWCTYLQSSAATERNIMAEAVRFELTNGCPLPVFKSGVPCWPRTRRRGTGGETRA
jgi:hypothetical protein